MNNLNKFIRCLATFGYIGNIKGSGTLGSLIALPAAYCFYPYFIGHSFWIIFLFVVVLLISYFIVATACKSFLSNDPSEIVLDEFVGCLLTFCYIPLNCYVLAVGFMLFRFFDITKTFGISFLERRFKGPFGIMIDDLAAGLISNILLRIMFV